ncbi:hypothetical protein DP939_21460 [Spongiactinospora rosea]|uniref:Uncharacterized protein n=1 Tax=Spongiactinospora rosea TaxID=2248750 RepID=A0A366LVG5_9ACTN|nr:hypothetical protein [Spongiactinospora rosea]RBQ17945.1 hypothetical protein DP939_21460 [Spongiactinospora rosea]
MKLAEVASRLSIVTATAIAVAATFAGPLTGTATAATGTSTAATKTQTMGWPTGCHWEILSWQYTGAICAENNGGWYQAIAICKNHETDKLFDRYGPWRQTGPSFAYCQAAEKVESAGYATQP